MLTGLLEAQLGEPVAQAIHRLYDGGRVMIAGFAPVLLEAAKQGDAVALEQAEMARDAGARYIISPNVDPAVIKKTRAMGLVSMPGAMTPTEAHAAHAAGADFVKLFPAGVLGADYLRAMRAPLGHLLYLAVGGVNEKNIPAFMAAGAEGFGVGGNLVNREWIEAGAFGRITDLARKYVDAVNQDK